MSCLFPGSQNLDQFYNNIINGVSSIADVSQNDWDYPKFYDKNNTDISKIYCKRGGFISANAYFDPLEFGIMPNSINGSDPEHFLALKVASEAIKDTKSDISKYRTNANVFIARNGAPGAGAINLIQHGQTLNQVNDILKSLNVDNSDKICQELKLSLNPCNNDTIPGVMPNIIAGRIASKFGFHGKTLIIDSACASSLIALELAINDIMLAKSDIALVGGIHVNSFPFYYQMFCGIGALSRDETIRPYDENANGTLLADGLGMIVVKRLSDAIKDGDRIYATVLATTSTSSGNSVGILAPSVSDEVKTMANAYSQAKLEPSSIGLLEGHGTSTKAGDIAELMAIKEVFTDHNYSNIALGCVKSQIGHTQAASGMAGLIKSALALYHKILPPTLNNTIANKAIDWNEFPCYLNKESKPWVSAKDNLTTTKLANTRLAGINAFGFGGTNAHAILREFTDTKAKFQYLNSYLTEIVLITAVNISELINILTILTIQLNNFSDIDFKHIAYSLNKQYFNVEHKYGIAYIANDIHEFLAQLAKTTELNWKNNLDTHILANLEKLGIYVKLPQTKASGKLAYIFPGLGSSYKNMLSDLLIHFPQLTDIFDYVDFIAVQKQSSIVPSTYVYPKRYNNLNDQDLSIVDPSVIILIMAEYAIFNLLRNLGIQPAALAGVSTGEYTCVMAANGCALEVAIPVFYDLSLSLTSKLRNYLLNNFKSVILDGNYNDSLSIARQYNLNLNASLGCNRNIVTGSNHDITTFINKTKIDYQLLKNPLVFHMPQIKDLLDFNDLPLNDLKITLPQLPIWSAATAKVQNNKEQLIKTITSELLFQPIKFQQMIENMVNDGFTTFIEVGPRNLSASFINGSNFDSNIVAIPSNIASKNDITQIQVLLGQLFKLDYDFNVDYFYENRKLDLIDFTNYKINSKGILLNLQYPEIKFANDFISQNIDFKPETIISTQYLHNQATNEDFINSNLNDDNIVINNYLETLNKSYKILLDAQTESIQTLIKTATPINDNQVLPNDFPFLINLLNINQTDSQIEFSLCLNNVDFPFIEDHCIGGVIDNLANKVYILPLMVSLEILAQANAYFTSNDRPSQINDIKALKRIKINHDTTNIFIKCKLSDNVIHSNIYLSANNSSRIGSNLVNDLDLFAEANLALSATFVYNELNNSLLLNSHSDIDSTNSLLSNAFLANDSSSKHSSLFSLHSDKKSTINILADPVFINKKNCTITNLYDLNSMFHGPKLQATKLINQVYENGIITILEAREHYSWFKQPLANSLYRDLLINPLCLDNATQAAFYYLINNKEKVQALLPFHIDCINFNNFIAAYKQNIEVKLIITQNDSLYLKADIILSSHANTHDIEIASITWRKIRVSPLIQNYICNAKDNYLSQNIDLSTFSLQTMVSKYKLAINYIKSDQLLIDETSNNWLLDYILANDEFLEYSLIKNKIQKNEFILAKIALKDAIRQSLVPNLVNLYPCDINIIKQSNGAPLIDMITPYHNSYNNDIQMGNSISQSLIISTSHKPGIAIAIASCDPEITRIGIDLESIYADISLDNNLAFTKDEIELLSQHDAHNINKLLIQLWSAKEAYGKALGIGLSFNPRNIVLQNIDGIRFTLALKDRFVLNQPHLADNAKSYVYCFDQIIADYILAVCII